MDNFLYLIFIHLFGRFLFVFFVDNYIVVIYFSENFPFFEFANPGWKNSIRHNLSLNKNFLKIEQDKTGSRKSCLWQFNPEKLDKVDSELNKYDENEIRRSLRFPG